MSMLDLTKLEETRTGTKIIELETLKEELEELHKENPDINIDDIGYEVEIEKVSFGTLRKASKIARGKLKINMSLANMGDKEAVKKEMEGKEIPIDMGERMDNTMQSVLFLCSEGLKIDGKKIQANKIDKLFSDAVKTEIHDEIVLFSGGKLEEEDLDSESGEEFRDETQD